MRDTFFWRLIAILGVAGLFYVGAGLAGRVPSASLENVAHGGLIMPENHLGWNVITSSQDGKSLYFYGDRKHIHVPKEFGYLGKLEATP